MALYQVLALVLGVAALAQAKQCVQGVNCHLPDCFCPTFKHPMGAKNIPQIIYFGFDDAVTPEVSYYFERLFRKDRMNPNGCPITMSLYVCHRYTIYSLVEEFFTKFDEIAVHSVTHTYIDTADKLREEATQQKDNIEADAKVPAGDIIGWRSPDLISAGDAQPRILKELNFTYDISLPYEFDDNIPFPYTLDFGYPFSCSIGPCPSHNTSHTGFWEVPINTLYDTKNDIPCTYVDGCRPDTEDDAYEFLMENFHRTYNRDKSPLGLNMHAAWFYFPIYFRATDRFIQTILNNYPDVYILSVKQMMAWMRTPQNIQNSRNFAPWGCSKEPELKKPKSKAPTVSADKLTPPVVERAHNTKDTKDAKPQLNSLRAWILQYRQKLASKQANTNIEH